MSTYWNTGDWIWLRAPEITPDFYARVANSGNNVFSHGVNCSYGVQPASNLNLSSVIFASAASAASSDTVEAGTIQTGKAMTLRLDGSTKDIGNAIYDSTKAEMFFVQKSSEATGTVSLVVQGNDGINDWYYSKAVTDAEVIYMNNIKTALNLSDDISVDECEIWLETTVDGMVYAKPMTNGELICYLDVYVDEPKPGEALDTEIEIDFITLRDVKWLDGYSDVTGTAEYDKSYKVEMTFLKMNGTYFLTPLKARVNGNQATISINKDGTVTVVYTFPRTEKGTISYTAEGYAGIYDGKSHGITITVTNPTDAKISYSTDGTAYSETNPTFTDAGDYTIYYKVEKENYETITGSKTVKISKKELTITAADQTITYGDDIDTSKYAVTGLLDNNIVSKISLTPSATELSDNGTISVSGAKIVNAVGRDVTANYNIIYTAGKLVINEVEEKPNSDGTSPEEPVSYGITVGADSKWTVNSVEGITITGNGEFSKFVGVKVDGAFIDKENYTVKSGSTIVTLKESYLNTLSVGAHTFEIVWTDGSVKTIFTIEKAAETTTISPKTGDSILIGLCIMFLIGCGLIIVRVWKKDGVETR